MATFLDAATSALRASYCAATARLGVYSEMYLGGANPIGQAGVGAANFLHNLACNIPPPDPAPPPFTGGQCNGVTYTVNALAKYGPDSTPGTIAVSGLAVGPVTGVTSQNVAGNSTQIFAIGKATTSTPSGRYGIGSVPTSFASTNNFQSVSITSVSRQDSGADNCGNPPGIRPPYTPGTNIVNTNISYTNSSNTNVTVPVVIALGYAKIDINGQLNVPFNLTANITPTANISGTINLNTGDINFDAGNPSLPSSPNGGNSDDYSPDPSDTVPTDPTVPNVPDPTPDPAKPQTRRLLVGCLVTTSNLPKGSSVIYQTGSPDVYSPDLGLVSFKVSISGYVGWTADIRVKNKRQFIPCPWKGGAIDVTGTPRAGGTFVITPIFEKVTLGTSYLA